MALFDFGMKARRELDRLEAQYEALFDDFIEVRRERLKFKVALHGITEVIEEPTSANIAREAIGRPVKGGGDE